MHCYGCGIKLGDGRLRKGVMVQKIQALANIDRFNRTDVISTEASDPSSEAKWRDLFNLFK